MNKENTIAFLKNASLLASSSTLSSQTPASTLLNTSVVQGGTAGLADLMPGSVFYVDSVSGSDSNTGADWDNALATIDAAVNLCTDYAGDVILVAPYHQEVQAASGNMITLDVAGVSIIGCGTGSTHSVVATGASTLHGGPTLICDHASAVAIYVISPSCRISGINFVSDVADVAKMVYIYGVSTVNGDGAIVENCTFKDNGAALEYLVGIQVASSADCQILNNTFYTTAAGGTDNAIKLGSACHKTLIQGNKAFGKFATGGILTSAVLTGLMIIDNIIVNAEAAIAIALSGTTSTGVLARNLLGGTTSIAAALTGDDAMFCFENYVTGAAGASGIINPAVDAD